MAQAAGYNKSILLRISNIRMFGGVLTPPEADDPVASCI
jgi:hypothetical protein